MVQIIPKADSFGEQFGRSLGGGIGQGLSSVMQNKVNERSQLKQYSKRSEMESAAKFKEMAQKQEIEKKAIADKLAMFEKPEYADFFKGLDPQMANLSKAAMAGLIEPGVATEMAKMFRTTKQHESFLNKLMDQGGNESQGQDVLGNQGMPNEMQDSGNMPEESGMSGGQDIINPKPNLKQPTKTPKKIDYDKEIARLQAAYPDATLQSDKNLLDSKIKELQKLRDVEEQKRRFDQDFDFKNKLAQDKKVTASFEENKAFIDKTYDQYEDSLRKDAILDRMNELSESGELSDSGIINLLESLGFQQEWLKNPANEEYTKLALDLLGGGTLQADYGNRLLASEFKVSQQRIPSLMQTKEGQRQIAENLKTMLLPSKLKRERMQYYLDEQQRTGEPLPHNMRGKILEDIKPQLEEAYDKFKQRNGRYKVKEGTSPDDNAIEKYYYISNGNENNALKLMKEDGYDVGFE